jgi:SRSO17 transposase
MLEDPAGTAWDVAKLRWRIERDYQELKQELGLGHFVQDRSHLPCPRTSEVL